MKELSIEEKAKRFDEAIKKAKSKIKNDKDHVLYEDDVVEIFPELKESEDERIRKAIIEHFEGSHSSMYPYKGFIKEQILAWLEKQGEQKPDDKVEPKFKIGDIIRLKDGDGLEWTVEGVLNNGYYTIVCADRDDFIQLDDKWELVEQKPAWSEEDEMHIRELESLVKQVWATAEYENDKNTIHKMSDLSFFLKTLKPQLKQELSEEDCNQIETIACHLDNIGNVAMAESLLNIMDKYKSSRPQSTWKPSDEQMEALNYVVNLMASSERPTENDLYYNILKSLRQQLKKLK